MSKKIVFDPGHGGTDPGATGNGLLEKDVTLKLVSKTINKLSEYEVTNISTRVDDSYISLSGRAKIANDYSADFLLSVHVDANKKKEATGGTFYIYPGASEQTKAIAELIHIEYVKVIRQYELSDRGVRTANFAVLRETNMPALLIENGFITNSRDADLLKNDKFLDDIAGGITNGLVRAFSLVKKQPISPTVVIEGVAYPAEIRNGQLVAVLPVREVFQQKLGHGVEWDKDRQVCNIRR